MEFGPIVNNVKCISCGKCIEVCPKDVFSFNINKKLTISSEGCMLCSHCYNICPVDAISFSEALKSVYFVSFDYSEKLKGSGDYSTEEIVNIIRSRRSVRRFKNETLHDNEIRDLVEFATTAPSGSNCQEWAFTVLNGRSKVWDLALEIKEFFRNLNRLAGSRLIRYLSFFFMGRALINYYRDHYDSVEMAVEESAKGRDLLFHGAPAVIIIHGPVNGSTPVEDGAYAAYNICLLAHYMNIGTCLIGFAVEAINRRKEIKLKFKIPTHHRVHAVIAAGYSDVKFLKQSLRKPYNLSFL
jgi:nitroreductase/NAD-dependent dihydropyrimidine dehydrogenase PreA subunit